MRVIGLTGSIACGKSTISRYLISLGFPVIDGDQISRELTAPGSPVLEEIRHNFGDRYMNENGNLNRRALGQLIFRDEHARSRLDAVMAPHLMRMTKEGIEQYRSEGADLCFLDMPLLLEKGYDSLCDSVWTVWLPEDIQLSRLMERDSLSEEDALRRIRSVMSSDEKASRADHVIDNSGTVRQTFSAVDRLLHDEMNSCAVAGSLPSAQPSSRQVSFRSQSSFIVSQSGLTGLPEKQSSDPAVSVMDRPAAARRQPSSRKAAWKMALWLKIALIASGVLLAVAITAYSMMSGYLSKQMKLHEEERNAVFDHYFVRVSGDSNEFEYRFSDRYKALILQYALKYNLDPAFVAAVILNESTFRADVVSPVGARGLMQLMSDTAGWIAEKLYVREFDFDLMFNAEDNIRFGCWYLNWLSDYFGGNLVCVISAYHTGQNKVKEWLNGNKTLELENLPDGPTKDYARKVTRDYGIYQVLWLSGNTADRASDGAGTSSR